MDKIKKAFDAGYLIFGQLKGWEMDPVIILDEVLDFDRYEYAVSDKRFEIENVDIRLFEYVSLLFFKNGIDVARWKTETPQARYNFIVRNRSINYCNLDYEDLWERLFETYHHFKNYSKMY